MYSVRQLQPVQFWFDIIQLGHILDDQDLVDTLQQSKGKSSEITKRVAQSEETEKKLNLARKRYLPVSLANHCTYLETKFDEVD